MEEMEEQNALLKHLMETEDDRYNNEFIYSFLLGSRLFLSPHQLLKEINQFTKEETAKLSQSTKPCSKCHRMHNNRTPKSPLTTPTESTPKPEGEATLRRRKRGRGRSSSSGISPIRNELLMSPIMTSSPVASSMTSSKSDFRLPVSSRDSGILSIVFDDLNIQDLASPKRLPPSPFATPLSTPLKHQCSTPLSSTQLSRLPLPTPTPVTGKCVCLKRRLVEVMYEWVLHFPSDFRNKKVMWTLNSIIKQCQVENKELSELCTKVVDCISRRTAAQESYEEELFNTDYWESDETLSKSVHLSRHTSIKFILQQKDAADVIKFARQLTLIEMDFLKFIGTEEFLQMFTADCDQDTRTNLGASVRWFNRLSRLVATMICMCRKRKQSRDVITFFIKVADACYQINNFNSSMSIWTGLNSGAVTRLHRVWSKIALPEWYRLQRAFDPSNNFQKYREIYTNRATYYASNEAKRSSLQQPIRFSGDMSRYSIISQQSTSSALSVDSHPADSGIECDNEIMMTSSLRQQHMTSSPTDMTSLVWQKQSYSYSHEDDNVLVPFLVLMVKDVYFLNHSIPTVHDDGKINVEKLRRLSNLLLPLEDWKQNNLSYERSDEIRNFFLCTPVLEDEDLYLASYKRETPSNNFERSQIRNLRTNKHQRKEAAVS